MCQSCAMPGTSSPQPSGLCCALTCVTLALREGARLPLPLWFTPQAPSTKGSTLLPTQFPQHLYSPQLVLFPGISAQRQNGQMLARGRRAPAHSAATHVRAGCPRSSGRGQEEPGDDPRSGQHDSSKSESQAERARPLAKCNLGEEFRSIFFLLDVSASS